MSSCDLLKNSYLCLLNNTSYPRLVIYNLVVICWKIRIFAYWTTPKGLGQAVARRLWFAEKFVSLLIEQHRAMKSEEQKISCDLLKNSYLCLLNNTPRYQGSTHGLVVICWKIRIFAYWTTPSDSLILASISLWFAEKFVSLLIEQHQLEEAGDTHTSCDLLKNSYLCLLNNTFQTYCPKERRLWFAEKFVSLLIEQHLLRVGGFVPGRCDLLKNSYLCLLNNTREAKRL